MSVATSQQLPSINASSATLFPLPLTPLETFLHVDSRPDYPMQVDMEIQLQGRLDRAALESGLAFAVARNPLFTCLVANADRGQLVWVLTDRSPPVHWGTLDEPLDESYGSFMDLTTQTGLRVWVRQGEQRSKVLCQFHHACSDGIGGFGFAEDLLAGYAAAIPGGQSVTPRPLEPDRLLGRGEAGIPPRTSFQKICDSFIGIFDGGKLLLHSPLPLTGGSLDDNAAVESAGRPGFITATLSEHVTAGLRYAAASSGGTTNDLLMRDLFLVLGRWNADHGQPPGRRRMRILMPQNLRGPDEGRMPAANVMSFAFVSRKSRGFDNPRELLHSIRAETTAIKRDMLSLYFIGHLVVAQAAGILSWLLRRRFCFATAVLSNLSYPTRRFVARFPDSTAGLLAGNLVVEGIVISPPLRPLTHAAFGIMSSDRTITISLRWDPHTSSPSGAGHLLGQYVAQLTATADGTPTGA